MRSTDLGARPLLSPDQQDAMKRVVTRTRAIREAEEGLTIARTRLHNSIREAFATGLTIQYIGAAVGLSPQRIRQIVQ